MTDQYIQMLLIRIRTGRGGGEYHRSIYPNVTHKDKNGKGRGVNMTDQYIQMLLKRIRKGRGEGGEYD